MTIDLGASTVSGVGDANGDTITGFESAIGTAQADNLTGSGAANSLDGGAGGDTLVGLGGADDIDGGANNDTITGGSGNDTIDGGTGTDRAIYTATASQISASASADGATVTLDASATGEGSDTLSNVEELDLGGTVHTLTTGNAGNDTLTGGSGADVMFGANGDDAIEGGGSDDLIDGGTGSDTAVYAGNRADYTITDLGGGVYTVQDDVTAGGDEGTDRLENVEFVQFDDVRLNLATGAVSITGTSGPDTMTGSANDDTFNGLGGNDTITGGGGNDVIDGGADTDVAVYAQAVGEYSVDASGGTITVVDTVTGNGDEGTDTLTNVETLRFNGVDFDVSSFVTSGTAASETIIGTSGDDSIITVDGSDVVFTGAGADTIDMSSNDSSQIYAGTGDDILINSWDTGSSYLPVFDGGAGTDTFRYTGGTAPNPRIWDLTTGEITYQGNPRGTIANIENVEILTDGGTVIGDGNDNVLTGGSGSFTHTFSGGGGNDTLSGGGGDDTLDGDAGDDIIYTGSGSDTVDGGEGSDTIYFDGTGISNEKDITDSGTTGSDTMILNGGNGDYYLQHTFNDTSGIEVINGVLASGETIGSTSSSAMNWDLTNVTLIGVDMVEGSNNGDTITGSAGDDTIDGDFGVDTVDGGAGNDTLILRDDGDDDNYAGGSGNDTFLVDADQMVNLNADSIDGGADTDTVSFDANSGSLTESQLVSVVSNVEVIDFSNAGINETLSLEGSQVQQMTDGNNVLRINVNAVGDDVTGVAGGGEFMQSNTSGSETIYTFYSDAGFTNQIAQLIVDEVA